MTIPHIATLDTEAWDAASDTNSEVPEETTERRCRRCGGRVVSTFVSVSFRFVVLFWWGVVGVVGVVGVGSESVWVDGFFRIIGKKHFF